MSDTSQGPGWWQASDGKWYPPEQAPGGGGTSGGASNPGESPWGVLAVWPQRALGLVIDIALVIVIYIVGFFLTIVVSAVSDVLGALVGLVFWLVYIFIWLYFGFLVGQKGRSPGMALTGLTCVGMDTGQPIGGGMGIVRGLLQSIINIACYISYLWPLWDTDRQTLADKVVKTVVIKDDATKSAFSADLFRP
jgi:uncharacterized RDD family membrane protein YckC